MYEVIAGVDEAGVSPIAGPVVAAAVILNPMKKIYKLRDSKILTPLIRELLYKKIEQRALAFSIGIASVDEIDHLNIYHATMLAMQRAIMDLKVKPTLVMIDGKSSPKIDLAVRTIVKGDSLIKAISAASIIAKVTRDHLMESYHLKYPLYNFAKHKGYPTKEHQTALELYGPCPLHRRSFNRVKKSIAAQLTTHP